MSFLLLIEFVLCLNLLFLIGLFRLHSELSLCVSSFKDTSSCVVMRIFIVFQLYGSESLFSFLRAQPLCVSLCASIFSQIEFKLYLSRKMVSVLNSGGIFMSLLICLLTSNISFKTTLLVFNKIKTTINQIPKKLLPASILSLSCLTKGLDSV